MKFYLGLHQPADAEKIRYPVFVSVSRLIYRKKPLDHSDWIMDSGGFTMISKNGHYTITEDAYINCIDRHNPRIAFCQDWMCEDHILKKTGKTVKEHQQLTLSNYLSSVKKEPRIRPVLQGWEPTDYTQHALMYKFEGVDLTQEFGVGTICSRNGKSDVILDILCNIKTIMPDSKLHGFGIKSDTLVKVAHLLESADSMAWSSRARRMKLCEPSCNTKSCANCLEFGLLWRKKILHNIKTIDTKV